MDIPKLVLRIHQHGRTLFGWVEYQDESLRRTTRYPQDILVECDDFEILSSSHPQLTKSTCYVWGADPSRDDVGFMYTYRTVSEAMAALDKIRRCVQLVNTEPDQTEKEMAVFERIA